MIVVAALMIWIGGGLAVGGVASIVDFRRGRQRDIARRLGQLDIRPALGRDRSGS